MEDREKGGKEMEKRQGMKTRKVGKNRKQIKYKIEIGRRKIWRKEKYLETQKQRKENMKLLQNEEVDKEKYK